MIGGRKRTTRPVGGRSTVLHRVVGWTTCISILLTACGSTHDGPREVIEAYAAAYNAHDLDAITALFADGSQILNHSIAGDVGGPDAIRRIHAEELDMAAPTMAYTFSNFEVSGSSVAWDAEWVNTSGEHWCKTGHLATVEAGAIVSWRWPDNSARC